MRMRLMLPPLSTKLANIAHASRRSSGLGKRAVLAALLLSSWILIAPGYAATIRVGTNPSTCDYTNLATALTNAVDGDQLLLETTEFLGTSGFNFNITSIGLTIRGGYPNCTSQVPTGRTILRGGGGDTVVEIGGPGSFTLGLQNLIITGGEDDSDDGGGIQISGDMDVVLLNVLVASNSSERGGGVFIDGSAGATLSTESTSFDNNTGTLAGGGIYCQNDGLITLNAQSQVVTNSTSGNGGGIWLGSGCHLDLLGSPTGNDNFIIVQSNMANGDGGGLYIDSAFVSGTGGRRGTLMISSNTAGRNSSFGVGGGFFITGNQARFDLDRGIVFGNRADQGGGFYAQGATVEVSFRQFGPCSSVFPNALCSEIGGNHAGFAAGMAVVDGAFADIELSLIHGNSSEGPGEAPIAFVASGGELIIEGSLVFNNGIPTGSGSGIVDTGGRVQSHSSTWVDNYGLDELFLVGGTFTGRASLFDTDAGALFTLMGGAQWSLDCAVYGPGLSLPAGGTQLVQAELGLMDPPSLNYHLAPNSPAIDLCSNSAPSLDRDIDYGIRPVGSGHDAGADEYDPQIFSNGFE